MNMFRSKMANRLVMSKSLGFLIGLIAFFLIPYVFSEADIYLRLAVLFWYTTFGVIIGLFGVMDKHPVFKSMKMPWWFRGAFMGAWLNFIVALFMYHTLGDLMVGTMFDGCSPFILVLEGLILGLLIDGIATKCSGEGKELCE